MDVVADLPADPKTAEAAQVGESALADLGSTASAKPGRTAPRSQDQLHASRTHRRVRPEVGRDMTLRDMSPRHLTSRHIGHTESWR
ncbi:hypothetical protein [Streptomyces sp. NBC_01462]|uniref:hypothetical protein n=1 Tax=Streptomyces sp. NBC_01462 TaxID=2903876 RepID=UPI002E333E0C|nr:hypothetical protein [Streptomyces sp. NBC_01462]